MNDATPPPSAPRDLTMSGRRLVPIMVVLIVLITAASIVTFMNQKHAFDYRTLCEENLKSLGVALFAYQEKFGSFPPASLMLGEKPAHSWRVLLLPMLHEKDADDLSAVYRWAEPWDSEHNSHLLNDFMPAAYHCPSQQRARWSFRHTHFVAPIGPLTAWPTSGPARVSPVGKQILLIEYRNEDIPWTKPQDLMVEAWPDETIGESKTGIGSPHGPEPLVLFADGTVERLPASTSLSELRKRCLKPGNTEK
ncbi:DUF1559 domain-containing protein [bacterium]|nr:DUF1559 domain-containing protein [bacterium]